MYAPLKITTDYTLLKSLIKINDLIDFCVKNDISACAICDNSLYGSIEFYKKAQEKNIKPIIGLDIDINHKHIYLYAKNYKGYQNLLKINTIICEDKISIYELEKYSSDVLSIIPYQSIKLYDELDFYTDLYIGYKNREEKENSLLKTNNVVYLQDVKVLDKNDLKYLSFLDKLGESKEKIEHKEEFLIKEIDVDDEKRIENVVNKLNLEIPFNERHIPIYNKDINSYEFLCNLAKTGLNKRLNGNVRKEYIKRLRYELSVINKMGFVDYFLIVYDYVLYAKKNGILVGPGRGSAAGSLVSYVIGITDIDPLKYNLLFERFLNYERVTMPDIDIDFDNTKRDMVIDYVKAKYGNEYVAGGLTYTTFKTRLVLRDVARILNIDDNLLNKFLKSLKKDLNLKENLKNKNVELYLKNYKELKELYAISLKLEGLKKNISTHAAGIVIGSVPLDEIIPMYKKGDVYLTGIGMEHLESLGLLKMDFLALKNLSTISNIIKQIPNFDLNKISLEDKQVYELFCKAETDGIFQFETISFKNILPEFSPQNFNELTSCIALTRPGPKRELETYIKRKKGIEKVTYYHENLKSILADTYGVIVYQEQVISILVKMANFTYAEADNIRRAMSKKKMDLIKNYESVFLKRSSVNGYSESLAKDIFNHILSFASYGFNKAHSVAYAYISYQMAYLKVHYKPLFIFELLNNDLGNIYKVNEALNELKKDNYIIRGVNINLSVSSFLLKDKVVYLPIKSIKGITSEVEKNILEERSKKAFLDIFDFFRRTYSFMNETDYKTLISAGALADFGNMQTIMNNLDSLLNYGLVWISVGDEALKPEMVLYEEYDASFLREEELKSYGFYITNHPASVYGASECMKLKNIKNNIFKNIICYVLVEDIKRIKTKSNEDMAFLRCSDETGEADFTVFPKSYYLLQNIRKNDMIKVWGKVSKRFAKYSIIVSNINKE